MNVRSKKVLYGTALTTACFAGAAVVSRTVTDFLLRVALDRDEPKILTRAKEHLMGAPENAVFMDRLRDASKSLAEKKTELRVITSHDGIKLVGHWYKCDNAARVIIAMHGWRSSWTQDFGLIADFWHDNGCSVLFVEQRAQGKSGGNYMGFGLTERYDCLEWIHHVNELTGAGLPIYLGGVSMGAATILMTAGLQLPRNVVGIVADSGFTSPHEVWKYVVENNLHMIYAIRSAAANDLCKKRTGIGAKDYSTMDALKKTDIPVLFIH